MKQWRMIIDVSKCENCNNCMLACKDEHVGNEWPGYTGSQPLHGHRWIHVERKERGQFPLVNVVYRPTPCQHCSDAPCVLKSDEAIRKRRDGIVLIDPVKAKGIKALANSCPYGMISWNDEKQVAQKCTLCAHLLDSGWKETRCVQACPTGALQLKCMDEREAHLLMMESEQFETLHPELGTAPSTLYKNLALFEKCFIAGSVAIEQDGRVDCAANARVVLMDLEREIQATETSSFGDFYFDGLEANGKSYEIMVESSGFLSHRVSIPALRTSVNIGTLTLKPAHVASGFQAEL